MYFQQADDPVTVLARLDRLCQHHDHLKALQREYGFMRHEQTHKRMADPTFCTDGTAMAQVDSPQWLRTSLVIKLPVEPLETLFTEVTAVYNGFRELIHRFYPGTEVDIYIESAHITVKTIAGDQPQTGADLNGYLAVIRPIVHHWLAKLGKATTLYAVGLFSSLSRERGLSLGLRIYPSLPLLQIIRGEIGVALYQQSPAMVLRPEAAFHTMLTHSTGFRARLANFPLDLDFIDQFRTLLEQSDQKLFGVVGSLTAADFVIRHGYSDQLIPLVEVTCQ